MLPLSKSHYYVIINKDETFPIKEVAEGQSQKYYLYYNYWNS